MTRTEVVKHFINHKPAHTPYRDAPLNGIWRWHGASLWTATGEVLVSYETPIAKWQGDKIAITDKKYSYTTSRQVSELKWQCSQAGIETVTL